LVFKYTEFDLLNQDTRPPSSYGEGIGLPTSTRARRVFQVISLDSCGQGARSLATKQSTSANGRRSSARDRDRSYRSHQSRRPKVGKCGQVWDQAPTRKERQMARPISGFKIARRLKWSEDRSKGTSRQGQVDQEPTGVDRPISNTRSRSQIGSTDLTF